MPRKFHKVDSYHGGLNTKSDARDILDNQLSEAKDVSVDDIGRITNAGSLTTITNSASTKPEVSTNIRGYGLFRFSSDFHKDWDGDPAPTRTDYILAYREADQKLYWSPDGGDWETPTHLNTSVDFLDLQSDESPKLFFYSVDGAIRASDATFAAGNDPVWIGALNRTLYTDGVTVDKKGWYKEDQALSSPTSGEMKLVAPTNAAALSDDRIWWHGRNLRDDTEEIGTSSQLFSSSSAFTMTDSSGNVRQHDERYAGGFDGSTYYRRFGWQLGTDSSPVTSDQADIRHEWTSPSFTSPSDNLVSGKSYYIAVRTEDKENRDMWLGTHTLAIADSVVCQIKFTNARITIKNSSNQTFYWEVDITPILEANYGEWVVLELPYDEITGKSNTAVTSMTPTGFTFRADLSLQFTGSGGLSTEGGPDDSYSVLHVSDLRVGDSDKVGSSGAKGIKDFAYSFIYDENQDAESLLYSFPSSIALHPNDWGYKIGINAYIKSITNNRITGSNLYMIDEDVPYRVSELDFLKGLKGAWEPDFPADKLGSTIDAFATFSSTCNKSNLIETTGLPLLESFDALNGFKSTVDTISAKYKTAVVLNRKVYIGNIEQDGKVYGDRMIKSVTNSFDCFPSAGREIDVAINDGDDIIHLNTYADRILQFKRNTMYLINATKSTEFLEDTFVGMGITHPGAASKTDFGVAWANENGCYLYDGQKVTNLTEGSIKPSEWADHIMPNSQTFYLPNKRKLFVTGSWVNDSGNSYRDLYEYCLTTQGWTRHQQKLNFATYSNFILDNNVVKVLDSSGNLLQWDDSESSTANLLIKTKDIDFGNPGTLKRIYKVILTWKSPNDAVDAAADSNVTITYGTNGESAQTKNLEYGANVGSPPPMGDLGTPTGTDWNVTTLKPNVSSEANSIRSIQLKIAANGTVPKNFQINDMTIVYRERTLR